MTSPEPNLTLVDTDGPTGSTVGPRDERIGQRIDGRYVIEKILGQGGMGVVYKGIHEVLEKPVAIKVLKPEVSQDEKVIARFKREARAASAIGSPHICDVSDFGTLEDGSTYFVMEMLDGPALSKCMKRGAPMETARVLKIGAQLCDALGAAHARGIVHRDLKPDNVHLVKHGNDDEFVKVLDFGIAKVASTTETKLTQAGQVFGTPHYMSPEQCAGHEVDHRTDIYALGVMLYEMACGKVPFDAGNLMGLLTKHIYEQPIPPHELSLPVEVPPGLEAIILKCLSKKPASRYQTMEELKADLDAQAEGTTPGAVMSALDRSLPAIPADAYTSMDDGEPPPRAVKTSSGLILGVATPLIALCAFGVAYFVFPGDEPTSSDTIAVDDPAPPDPDPDVDPDPEPDSEPVAPEPAASASPTVHLVTTPEGAEVYGPDGSLVGNTPVDIRKPLPGEPPVAYRIHLAGYDERTFTVGSGTGRRVNLAIERSRGRTGRPGGRGTATTPPAGRDTPPTELPTPPPDDPLGPSASDLHDPFER